MMQRGKDAALDVMAAEVAGLDPRFRVATDNPECFLCGKRILPGKALGLETAASQRLHFHAECAGSLPPVEIAARYWMAIRAAIHGRAETPNPGPARVHGSFR